MPRIQPDQPKAPFEQRLAKEPLLIKEQIKSLPQGRERDLCKARQLETASHITKWLSSPGLASKPVGVVAAFKRAFH
jgi:hypothetical protein